jgi:hypothetical protein
MDEKTAQGVLELLTDTKDASINFRLSSTLKSALERMAAQDCRTLSDTINIILAKAVVGKAAQ